MQHQKAITDLTLTNLNIKCGEIYFSANNYSFVCLTCELKIEDFIEFRLHIEDLHLQDFARSEKSTPQDHIISMPKDETLQITNHSKTLKDNTGDPLSWICDADDEFENPFKEAFQSYDELKSLTTCSPSANAEPDAEKIEKNSQLVDDNGDLAINYNSLHIDDVSTIDWTESYKPSDNSIKRAYKPRNTPNFCTFCGRTFRRRYQLDTHLNIHTGTKPFQCDICGRRFRALTTLQRHLNTHENQKDYVCKFCDKSFSHRAALLSHESRHVQKRTVCCDECEKKFYTVNQCDTHKRRIHSKSNAAFPSLPFACNICPKKYRSASMLSTHKLRKHLKTAKFSCEKCEKKFVDQEMLEKHQIIHTNKVDGT